ncbi:MAG: hypothetical protein D6690_09580 [Nitrospirae bacterium]|nr:MAG: hypothetical protein D6690_09580 [Nitrospirota bacterium]
MLDDLAERILLGGYGALEFEAFGGSDVTFEGKLEVIISGHIHDRIRIYNEIDLGVPTGTAKAEQSYVDLLFIPWFNLRAGVVLVPFGKFNLDHFDPRRDLTDRPLVARQIVPTTWGDLGASVFGLIRLTPDLKVTYEAALINGLTNQFDPPSSGLRSARSALGKDNNGDKAFVGRATLMLADQYEIGISGYRGASGPANGTPITGVGLDLEFKPRNTPILEDWEFKGEYAQFLVRNSDTLSRLSGLYVQVNYHFWLPWLNRTILGSPFLHPTLTLVGRYDHASIHSAAAGHLEQDRFTVGLNYRPIEDYVIKTEYQINQGSIERRNWEGFLASVSWLF